MKLDTIPDVLATPLMREILRMAGYALAILGVMLLFVLIMIIVLRKVLGDIQNRIGPNRVGPRGWGQTAADALKLLLKEDVIPTLADRAVFMVAPALVFVPAYLVYVVIPFGPGVVAADLNIGILFIAAITSVAVIGFITAGWASNNKYSLLGGMRSAAQIVSYEVPLILAMLGPVVLAGSLRLSDIVHAQETVWLVFITPIMALLFLIAGLAEINITPFDMVEAESELVAGFNTEYSGMKFALFFLAEFANTFTMAVIAVCLYLGGWTLPFWTGANEWMATSGLLGKLVAIAVILAKGWVIVWLTIVIRGTLPRVRVDQLMEMGWKGMIPLALVGLLINALFVTLPFPPAARMWGLAVVNWVTLLGVIGLGMRKKVSTDTTWTREVTHASVPERSRL